MELGELTSRSVQIGQRTGHQICLRAWAIQRHGIERVGHLTDIQVIDLMLADGFIPVVVEGLQCDDETVYLIEKNILEAAPKLTR